MHPLKTAIIDKQMVSLCAYHTVTDLLNLVKMSPIKVQWPAGQDHGKSQSGHERCLVHYGQNKRWFEAVVACSARDK